MFINPETALSPSRELILSGRRIRTILSLAGERCDAWRSAPGDGLDALAIRVPATAGGAIGPVLRKARAAHPSLVQLAEIDGQADPDTTDALLSAITPARPDGLILTGVHHGKDLQRFDVQLTVAEAAAGLEPGATTLIAMVGDNPDGLMDAASFAGRTPRLKAIGCDTTRLAEGLAVTTDAETQALPAALTLGRGMSVLAAAKTGVAALERIAPRLEGVALENACRRATSDGFSVLLCEEPRQLPLIAGLYR